MSGSDVSTMPAESDQKSEVKSPADNPQVDVLDLMEESAGQAKQLSEDYANGTRRFTLGDGGFAITGLEKNPTPKADAPTTVEVSDEKSPVAEERRKIDGLLEQNREERFAIESERRGLDDKLNELDYKLRKNEEEQFEAWSLGDRLELKREQRRLETERKAIEDQRRAVEGERERNDYDRQDLEGARNELPRKQFENNLDEKLKDTKDEFLKKEFKMEIDKFENRKPPVSSEEKARIFEQLNKLLEAKDPPPRADLPKERERIQLALQVLHHANTPDSVDQGNHNTCGAAALESRLYTKNPATAAEMVTEVATTGKFTPKHPENAQPVEIHKSILQPDREGKDSIKTGKLDGERDYASQIFQGTANSLVKDGYHQVKPRQGDPKDTGERTKYGDFDGIYPQELEEMETEITGKEKPTNVIAFGRGERAEPTHVESEQELRIRLAELKRRGELPVVIGVDSTKEPFYTDSLAPYAGGGGGSHFVTITDYDETTGEVTVDNQWGTQSDHNGGEGNGKRKKLSSQEMFDSMQRPRPARR